MPEIRATGVRFQEAIDYLKGKLPEASVAWNDLAGPVHGKVFTVAGATTADLARDIQASLANALANGGTLGTFRKDFDAIVAKHGWSYNGSRGWRTAVIFDTNMRSSHMAGRWAQLEAGKAQRPYLEYRTAGDARVRPQHRAWNGLIYPVDDAFWRTHYPPNGWGCRCTVRAYNQREMDRKGLQVSQPHTVKYRDVVTRDGEITDRVPVGIDPGWDHNVGMSWTSPELALGHKLARLPRELRGPVTDKAISPAFQQAISERWKAFQTAVKATGKPVGDAQILGFLDSSTLDAMADQVPDLALKSSAIAAFDRRTAHLAGGHKAVANPDQVWPGTEIDDLPALLRSYSAVLWDRLDQVLVVVPRSSTSDGDITQASRLQKIVLRPNVTTKYGSALSLVSLGTAARHNLAESRYLVLVGKLPGGVK